jgi:hypothetical protein
MLDGARDATTARESTPERPGARPAAHDGSRKPDAQLAKSDDARGNRGRPEPGLNQESSPPGKTAGADPATRADARDSWGTLPEHVRDIFRTQGGGDMPARYREWIDAYYKRLNKER